MKAGYVGRRKERGKYILEFARLYRALGSAKESTGERLIKGVLIKYTCFAGLVRARAHNQDPRAVYFNLNECENLSSYLIRFNRRCG